MKLPTIPPRGADFVPQQYFLDDVACLRSLKIQQSPDIVPMEGAGGTQLFLTSSNGRKTVTNNFIQFGSTVTAFTTGATIGLYYSNVSGATASTAQISAYLMKDQSTYTTSNGTSISAGTVIPYVTGPTGGNIYVFGTPMILVHDFQWNTAVRALQVKTVDHWGYFQTTASTWVNRETAVTC